MLTAHLTSSPSSGQQTTARRLFDARAKGLAVPKYDPVADLDAAYSVQAQCIQLSNDEQEKGLGNHCGWKCGFTSEKGYTSAGLKEPMRGPLFGKSVFQSTCCAEIPAHLK